MRFEGTFSVPAEPRQVLDAFADVELMVPCMPGASLQGHDENGLYLGTMTVAFGPKKVRFKGKIRNSVDPQTMTGTLDVRGGADMRLPAPAAVHVEYAIAAAADATADAPASVVTLVCDAELGGVLADFARTGGNAVTQALMEIFAQNLAMVVGDRPAVSTPYIDPGMGQPVQTSGVVQAVGAAGEAVPDSARPRQPHVSPPSEGARAATATPAQPRPQAARQSLSAFGLLWILIKSKFSALIGGRRP
ncbi:MULTISPECIES: SRPBCC domain-containing protein [unclassified Achromobacter]|uniref:SRPBCC domain-containing protein n=1 Tax=unclassified Achromobacter TaxID=2626865 RepID=UPI000B516E76|nr:MULTISPECIES: SRPBCC domain-containing protein [unclassified Achromobacter]OWT77093.1 hypothetical protein CEY04_13970 [Achromobacter sp. HZ28]OWT77974.1 hypothetical protein CEY05_08465 [Achromobacter sp. HZ34]